MQSNGARQRATETKLLRAMERWRAKATSMTPAKGAAFINRKLKERVRLQAKYRSARRPAEAPATSQMSSEDLFSPLQPSRSSSVSGEMSPLDTDAARVFDEWFSEWFVDCAASGLLCSELLSENL